MRAYARLWIVLIILASSTVFILQPLDFTGFFVYTSGGNAGMALWDLTDAEGGNWKVYAEGSQLGSGPNSTTTAIFYANYTNLTSGQSINGTGVWCNISFNNVSGWTPPSSMTFNSSSKLYEYGRTFNSRGIYPWNVTCDGSSLGFTALSATDNNVTVTNTPAGIYVPLNPKTCYEDTACSYNFSTDCYDIDSVDANNLTYGYKAGTEFPGFSMNGGNGMVTVSITNDNGCGDFLVTLVDKDSTGWGATADKEFIVNAVNDAPVLANLPSSSNQNSTLLKTVTATDEETAAGPFLFNMSFLYCYRPFTSDHSNLTNCSGLFAMNLTGAINRSAIFRNSEVGTYTINFSATDPGDNLTGTTKPPYTWLANATGWQVLNFTVVDMNDQPSIDQIANQFWAQNQNASLVVHASDIDNGTLVFNATTLYRNLSRYVNSTLFPISMNMTLYQDNGTSLGNATMNITPIVNGQVGNYTVNISVYDGRANGTYSMLVNFTVSNINDPPVLNFSCGNYSVEGMGYACNAGQNSSDPDNFPSYVPYTDSVNGTLSFYVNFTHCNKTFNASDTNCSVFGINQATGIINYTNPLRKDAGNYTINVSVTDGGNLTSWTLLNFTVIPDYAPSITTSVPPQNATQNQSFYLGINATDQDNATDALVFRTETYYGGALLNSTRFPIQTNNGLWPPGPAIGVMNYTSVNNSQVGNYTVKIIVNDTWGREDYITVNFTVYNLNDPPVLNFSCANYTYESTYYSPTSYACNAGQNTTDPDQQTPYGENLTYGIAFITGSPLFAINSSTGLINFTASNDTFANNTLNYTYVLNVTVNDSGGLAEWRIFNITVYAVNDPPLFNFTNTTAYVNSTYFENVSSGIADEENDLPLFYNLTFVNCSKTNTSDANCSVFGINGSSGVTSFYALEKDAGNYTVNVTVTDSGNSSQPHNATGWKLVDFRIRSPNRPPVVDIAGVIPGSSFYENATATFLISVSDADGDQVYCTWYRNSTLIGSVDNCQGSNSWSYTPGFDDSGFWTIKLEATDTTATSSDGWNVTILNRNRPPELVYPVQNQSWNMNTVNRNLILSYNFVDPDNSNNVTNDDNNITINWTLPGHVYVTVDGQLLPPLTVSPSNWTGKAIVTLTPYADWYGIEYMNFTVNDLEFSALSNNVTLNVSYTETQTQAVVQQTGGGGGGGTMTGAKVASLTITVSPFERVVSYNRTSAIVTLKNTGEVPLNDISMESYVKETDEITPSLSIKRFGQLAIGGSVNTTLTLITFQLTKESYEIKVTGIVANPKFNQSTTIYIKPLFNETKLEQKLQFVKDLFQDNPECIDLMELIIQAEKEVSGNNVEKAEELTQAALDNCRDIIRYSNATGRKVTPETEQIPVNEIIIALLAITLFTILAYLWIERRAGSKKARKA